MDGRPDFGLNRFDWTSTEGFVADVQRAEELGWGYALIPWNPLSRRDPYMELAIAAGRTSRIKLGLLLDNPVLHHPAVSASSIATLDIMSGGRALLTLGVGDTAVRWLGLRPARMAELEEATVLARRLLAGEEVDVGAVRPAQLVHARPVPIWIAAGGPKTIEMAGRVADGVFLRVGRHPENLRTAIERVHTGAREAGRDPHEIGIGLIFHTVMSDDPAEIRATARSMAAGYYEYSPALFEIPGLPWDGPSVEELKSRSTPISTTRRTWSSPETSSASLTRRRRTRSRCSGRRTTSRGKCERLSRPSGGWTSSCRTRCRCRFRARRSPGRFRRRWREPTTRPGSPPR